MKHAAAQTLGWMQSQSTLIGAAILVAYGLISFPLLLHWPPPWPDEVCFAEPAHVLADTGILGSRVILGMEHHVYWQPPGYFLFLAGIIRIVGFELPLLRGISVLIGALILVSVYHLALRVTQKGTVALLAMGLLAINPNFVTYIKLVRMDGLCVLLQLAGFILIISDRVALSHLRLMGAGILLTLALLSHPLGAVGFGTVFVHILNRCDMPRRRRLADVLLLIMPLLAGLALYGWYVSGDPPAFAAQMGMQFDRKMRPLWESGYNFIVRYRSLPAFALAAALGAVVWVRGRLWRRSPAHHTLGWGLVLVTVCVIAMFELSYHVYLLPLASIALAIAADDVWHKAGVPVKKMSVALLTVVVLNFVAYSTYLALLYNGPFSSPLTYAQLFAAAGAKIPKGATVVLHGYPDGYWYLREHRPDVTLFESVTFSDDQRKALRSQTSHVVIARMFDPRQDSVSLFADMRRLLPPDEGYDRFTILASVGEQKSFYLSAWVIEWPPAPSAHGTQR